MMPLKIVTLGRNVGTEVNNRFIGSSNDANFFLGLDYDMAPQFTAAVRQGARTQRNADVNDGFTSNSNNFNMQQAARVSDYTAFMYMGELIEFGATDQIFTKPLLKKTEEYITGRYG